MDCDDTSNDVNVDVDGDGDFNDLYSSNLIVMVM